MKKEKPLCLNCSTPVSRRPKVYCNNQCQNDYQYKKFIVKWKNNEVTGVVGYEVSMHIRRYLFEKHGNKCQICGWSKINQTTGKIPLEIHHVDGSYEHCNESNLQLLCPCCHSLTPNTGVLNKGNGRKYKRVKMGG